MIQPADEATVIKLKSYHSPVSSQLKNMMKVNTVLQNNYSVLFQSPRFLISHELTFLRLLHTYVPTSKLLSDLHKISHGKVLRDIQLLFQQFTGVQFFIIIDFKIGMR